MRKFDERDSAESSVEGVRQLGQGNLHLLDSDHPWPERAEWSGRRIDSGGIIIGVVVKGYPTAIAETRCREGGVSLRS